MEQRERKQQEHARPKALMMLIFALITGIAFAELIMRGGVRGIAVPVLVTLYYLTACFFLQGRENTFSMSSILLLLPIFGIAVSYILVDGVTVHFINAIALLILIPWQTAAMSGACKKPVFSGGGIVDTLTVSMGQPFENLGSAFSILGGSRRRPEQKKSRAGLRMALVGLLLALPVGLIFIALFSQADTMFRRFFEEISFEIDLGYTIFDLFFGILIAIFFAAQLISYATFRPLPRIHKTRTGALHPAATGGFLSIPILVQLAFIAVQAVYLLDTSGRNLPSGYIYSEYAREGFFQLLFANILTFIIILVVTLLVKRNAKGAIPLSNRLLLTLLTLCDFLLAASSLYRISLYVETYNLTIERLVAICLVVAMTLALCLLLFKIWLRAFRLTPSLILLAIVMVLAYTGLNPDRLVASYNVEAYQQGRAVSQFDLEYLGELSPAAAKPLEKLMDTDKRHLAKLAIRHIYLRYQNTRGTWRNFTITDPELERIVDQYQVMDEKSTPNDPYLFQDDEYIYSDGYGYYDGIGNLSLKG